MTDMHKEVIQRKIRELQQLESLLDDPDLSDVVKTIISAQPKPAPVAESQPALSFRKAPRRYQRNGGSLVDQTLVSLREYRRAATAADLAEFMKSAGYKFRAKRPSVAVSKVLRHLFDTHKIKSQRGEHAKSPICYWVEVKQPEVKAEPIEPPVWKVPVQEFTH